MRLSTLDGCFLPQFSCAPDYNRYPPSGGGNGQPYNQQNQNYGRPNDNQMNGPPQQSPNEQTQCMCGAPAKKYVLIFFWGSKYIR